MKKLALHWKILIGMLLGILFGLFLTEYLNYVGWMGELFMKALKMIVVPLIFTSIICGIINIGDVGSLGKLGLKTVLYYLTTSLFAIVTGLLVVNLLQPGVGADLGFVQSVEDIEAAKGSFGKTLINIIPENIFDAIAKGKILSIIFFSLLMGFFIVKLTKKHREFMVTTMNSGFELMMKITGFIIKFTPYGVFGIVAVVVGEQAGDTEALMNIVERLGIYMLAVIIALAIHFFILLPLLLKFVAKINPWMHLRAMSTPLLTAFSTSSSSATLPLTMDAIENKAGVSNKVTSFVLPLGATINMDGTALYECVAAMFIAQAYGIDLSIMDQVIVVITALLASIGAAGIPMAGLVMMSVVLTAVGLPLEGIGLILAVDRILDMFRTSVNVWSDSCGSVIIAKLEKEKLNYDK